MVSSLVRQFDNPPARYRPAPFWFWNDLSPQKFSPRALREQIRQMHDKGLGGFVLFNKPPYGFSPESFLSPRWFAACRTALEAASDFGLRVWINDDFDFPPGGLAGQMKLLVPAAYHRELICEQRHVKGGRRFGFTHHGEELVSAVALPEGSADLGKGIDLLAEFKTSGRSLTGKLPPGSWHLFFVTVHAVEKPEGHLHRFPSFLDPEVNAVFIANVYEQYKKHLGKYFGHPLVGFFSDCDARRSHPFPWARQFDERFRAITGYRIGPRLAGLWHDFGVESQTVRQDYFRVLSLLYAQWFENNHRWCQRHGLQYTYHTSDSGPFARDPEAEAFCGRSSYFSEGRFHDVNRHADYPGTDHELLALTGQLHFDICFSGKNEDYRPKTVRWGSSSVHESYARVRSENKTFGDVRAKYTSSVAHTYGRKGAMCEAFAATNWGATLDDFRWIANWQAVQGITFFVPHAFYSSLKGLRKEFAPPSHFVGTPLWPHYRALTDYIGRLGLMLSDAAHVADIAVLDPALSLWQGHTEPASTFFYILDALNHSSYGYDVLDEASLLKAGIDNGRLRIAGESYRAVILPARSAIDNGAVHQLSKFIESGGHVLSVGPQPTHLKGTGIQTIPCFRYRNDRIARTTPLHRWLASRIDPDLASPPASGVHFLHVRKNRRDVYFLTNLEGKEPTGRLSISFRDSAGVPRAWDPCTGKQSPIEWRRTGGRIESKLAIEPRQGLFVVFEDSSQTKPLDRPVSSQIPRKNLNVRLQGITPCRPNVLPVTVWSSSSSASPARRSCLPWGSVDLLKVRHAFFHFSCRDVLEPLELLVPAPLLEWPWTINAAALTLCPHEKLSLLDDDYCVQKITGKVRRGRNTLGLQIRDPALLGELAYTAPILRGPFCVRVESATRDQTVPYRSWYHFQSVIPRSAHGVLARPTAPLGWGSWSEQGYPFYSGQMDYSCTMDVDADDRGKSFLLTLGHVNGTVQVRVNDRPAGTLVWTPYQLEIGPWLVPGRNTIDLAVTNTLANILEEYPCPGGLMKEPVVVCSK